jgi:hypothetical protein
MEIFIMSKTNIFIIAIIPIFIIPFMIFAKSQNNTQYVPINYQESLATLNTEEKHPVSKIQVSTVVADTLENKFKEVSVTDKNWQQWIIYSSEDPWQAEELTMLNDILEAVISALDNQGLDGHKLLEGYRFRRQHGEYIIGYEGRVAEVNHEQKVITLADAAFKRLHGFYIIHELGHVVDRRTERNLTARFHTLAGSDFENKKTAPGFWLNLHAESDLEEATADAFALWIMNAYEADYKPVFAHTPTDAKYEQIGALIVDSVDSVALAQ